MITGATVLGLQLL